MMTKLEMLEARKQLAAAEAKTAEAFYNSARRDMEISRAAYIRAVELHIEILAEYAIAAEKELAALQAVQS